VTFIEKLIEASRRNHSLLCVGLDPDRDKVPERFRCEPDPILAWNRALIDSTADLVCAYKPNIAFYEALGAGGWQTFLRVTLPNIKWGLLYGVILCNARAMGEFGAVSVISGHIRGLTNTMPLHVEILYNEYNFVGAFAVASLLTFIALITLVIKSLAEWKFKEELRVD